MEPICIELLYGKISQILHCLGLCRKNPYKGVFVGLSLVLKVHLFWFWFGRKISGKKEEKKKIPIHVFCSTPLCLGEGLFA